MIGAGRLMQIPFKRSCEYWEGLVFVFGEGVEKGKLILLEICILFESVCNAVLTDAVLEVS